MASSELRKQNLYINNMDQLLRTKNIISACEKALRKSTKIDENQTRFGSMNMTILPSFPFTSKFFLK